MAGDGLESVRRDVEPSVLPGGATFSSGVGAPPGPPGAAAATTGPGAPPAVVRRLCTTDSCFPSAGGPLPPRVAGCTTCSAEAYGEPPEETVYNGILRLVGPRVANTKVEEWLDQLGDTSAGQQIFEALGKHSGMCTIAYYDAATFERFVTPSVAYTIDGIGPWSAATRFGELASATPDPPDQTERFRRGDGAEASSCLVTWDWAGGMGIWEIDSKRDPRDSGVENPGAALIGHELIHVVHALRGEWLPTIFGNGMASVEGEEARTIGMRWRGKPFYEGELMSENAIRRELGASMRQGHDSLPNRDQASSTMDVFAPTTPAKDHFGQGVIESERERTWGEFFWPF